MTQRMQLAEKRSRRALKENARGQNAVGFLELMEREDTNRKAKIVQNK